MVDWTVEGSSPAVNAVAVTPSDSVNLDDPARALFIGTGGNVVVIPAGSGASAVTFNNVQDGSILSVSAARVNATNTTASNIVALY